MFLLNTNSDNKKHSFPILSKRQTLIKAEYEELQCELELDKQKFKENV